MTSSTGKQIITLHMLPNISRSKGNQTMKSGQVTEYKMRNNCFEKSYTKWFETILIMFKLKQTRECAFKQNFSSRKTLQGIA